MVPFGSGGDASGSVRAMSSGFPHDAASSRIATAPRRTKRMSRLLSPVRDSASLTLVGKKGEASRLQAPGTRKINLFQAFREIEVGQKARESVDDRLAIGADGDVAHADHTRRIIGRDGAHELAFSP